MKIFRTIAFLSAVAVVIVCRDSISPIYAAPHSSAFQASAAANQDPMVQNSAGTGAASVAGSKVFQEHCAVCHGETMEGLKPSFPSLQGAGRRTDAQQITQIVRNGRGRMPGFSEAQLSTGDFNSLLAYLATDKTFMTLPAGAAVQTNAIAVVDPGAAIFQQNCAFCHGRDAAGGETGPDLTRSKLVAQDVKGDQIGVVVRNGRAEGKMPKFNFSDPEIADLVAFIHNQAKLAASKPGGRRGVDVADLQTGNVEAGKKYFDGAGGCASCHSPSGDLAGVASRYQGLQLEMQMLYPKNAVDKVTVTLPSGEVIKGVVAYHDEFVLGLRDSNGRYRSWPVGSVKYVIDSPVKAHADQFPKYTDDDIHNLMAYIQTLK